MKPKIRLGIERVLESRPCWLKEKRLGLLVNQASLDSRLRYTQQLIFQQFPKNLRVLFGPQHGFLGEKQDNMQESSHFFHPRFNIPVFSLYGDTRTPTKEMLDQIDVLIIDLQDVGTRVYTYISTMAFCLQAAYEQKKKVVVLDRPNPICGNIQEGNLIKEGFCSFVGVYPIPMRHGMTIGELAKFFNQYFDIGCDLEVVPMEGWKRHMWFADTGLTWAPPSPNMPGWGTAMVYPGQVLLEGTNISEGRGTTSPFEVFGAPFIDPFHLREILEAKRLKGVLFRDIFFQPTFNKWQGEVCGGLQIHITDRDAYKPYFSALTIIQAIISLYPQEFSWSLPPYEYEYHKMPIDLLLGDKKLREEVEQLKDLSKREESWQDELKDFTEKSKGYYLYQ